MPNINFYSPQTGRRIKEDNSIVNTADMIEAIYNALVVNKNAGMQLSGSIVSVYKSSATVTITPGSSVQLYANSEWKYKTFGVNARGSAQQVKLTYSEKFGANSTRQTDLITTTYLLNGRADCTGTNIALTAANQDASNNATISYFEIVGVN